MNTDMHIEVLCNVHMHDDGRQERANHIANNKYNKNVMPHVLCVYVVCQELKSILYVSSQIQ